ncbi:exov-like protein [uncultured Jannaschia sp.]|uniref:exov-like protein n=1 Tax=uncultured Jannaschia sp. TaxID=293347 RepID=UPI0026355623|nr:exov-like protein [uncultured Jannaschia sp.]
MRLFYNATSTNFGDHINSWLWPRLIPELLAREDDEVLVGVGSLLKSDLDRVPGEKHIFGTGSGYGPPPPPETARGWNVHCVRGPLTARHYGLEPQAAVTDGAWLIGQLPEWQGTFDTGGEVLFIPHWTSAAYGNWAPVCAMAGLTYVDPLDDGPSILRRIAAARLVVTESLHGAIFADYFRTPWAPVASANRVLHFKWVDWCMSIGVPYETRALPPSDLVDALIQRVRPSREMPSPDPRAYTADDFPYAPAAAVSDAGAAYRLKTRAKGVARGVRGRVLDGLRARRDGLGMGAWNRGYREEVAGYLGTLAGCDGMLSEDAVWDRLVGELGERLKGMI